jgi:hypothetical protein
MLILNNRQRASDIVQHRHLQETGNLGINSHILRIAMRIVGGEGR